MACGPGVVLMKRILAICFFLTLPVAAQQYKIAIVGMVHGHVWGHLNTMLKGEHAKLVGIAESEPELIQEAKRRGATSIPFFSDYRKMLDEFKPDIVWAFVENNRHLEIVKQCAPRKIQVIFEKPLASTYAEAVAIQQLANQYGIRVMTNYQMAWWPANYAAKAQADAGAVGRIVRLRGIVGHGGPGGLTGLGRFFIQWLTDPVKNGGGALMDFGCYNALWALWFMGRPETICAQVNHVRPQEFPKVEDNATLMLHYKDKVGIFEASWDLPRSFQDLEVFGLGGSLYMKNGSVELRKGRETKEVPLEPLPPERSDPIAYMVHCIRSNQPIQGLTALDINVGVNEIIEAAKISVQTGRAVKLPLAAVR